MDKKTRQVANRSNQRRRATKKSSTRRDTVEDDQLKPHYSAQGARRGRKERLVGQNTMGKLIEAIDNREKTTN